MMTPDVCAAVQLGQARLRRTAGVYPQSCLELALDELLRRPERAGEPTKLLDAALAHARTHLRRRRAICPVDPGSHLLGQAGHDSVSGSALEVAVTEMTDWLQRSTLSDRHRGLLLLAVADPNEPSICEQLGLTPTQLRQATARARQAARLAREREAVAA